jgi:hypothetical protein
VSGPEECKLVGEQYRLTKFCICVHDQNTWKKIKNDMNPTYAFSGVVSHHKYMAIINGTHTTIRMKKNTAAFTMSNAMFFTFQIRLMDWKIALSSMHPAMMPIVNEGVLK